jgi:hypothetical protein
MSNDENDNEFNYWAIFMITMSIMAALMTFAARWG